MIESIHIANDVVAHLDLDERPRQRGASTDSRRPVSSRPRSRDWVRPRRPSWSDASNIPDGWWRDTASRLIYRAAGSVDCRAVATTAGRVALRRRADAHPVVLDGLDALEEHDLTMALADASPGVREHAVRLAERRLADHPALLDKVLALAADPEPRVRFQAAFTLGETSDPRAIAALATSPCAISTTLGSARPCFHLCRAVWSNWSRLLVKDEAFLAQGGLPTRGWSNWPRSSAPASKRRKSRRFSMWPPVCRKIRPPPWPSYLAWARDAALGRLARRLYIRPPQPARYALLDDSC